MSDLPPSDHNMAPGTSVKEAEGNCEHECAVCGDRFVPEDIYQDTCMRCLTQGQVEDQP